MEATKITPDALYEASKHYQLTYLELPLEELQRLDKLYGSDYHTNYPNTREKDVLLKSIATKIAIAHAEMVQV